ncbi:hypothetical protein ACFSJY_13665 [Thalassotalea euphylliae]|uniref:hypothetical protein n=1 Tax=Thalassotalea euphylliae TaxID=1655234 RepID=UPI003637F9EE
MEVQSAFASGLQGFQNAQQTANEAAASIASQTVYSADNPSQGQQVNQDIVSENSSSGDLSDLNQEIVNLRVAEYQAKASAEVIQTADESLGTLLDVTA